MKTRDGRVEIVVHWDRVGYILVVVGSVLMAVGAPLTRKKTHV